MRLEFHLRTRLEIWIQNSLKKGVNSGDLQVEVVEGLQSIILLLLFQSSPFQTFTSL